MIDSHRKAKALKVVFMGVADEPGLKNIRQKESPELKNAVSTKEERKPLAQTTKSNKPKSGLQRESQKQKLRADYPPAVPRCITT